MQTQTIEPATRPRSASEAIPPADRRRHKRFNVERAGKLFRRATQKYEPLRTRNLSFSGALLELEPSRPLGVGELVDLAIAFRPTPLVESGSLVRAIVTRVEPVGAPGNGKQTVAVRYVQPA